MSEIFLVEPTEQMEAAAAAYKRDFVDHKEDHINGSCGWMQISAYADWLKRVRLARERETSPIGVPATTYFTVRKSDGKIIGSIQLRHELDEDLEKRGGHVGYGICPSERGKGYGNEQLAMILQKAKELGMRRVMISCDQDNLASAKVALHNGAVLTWEGYDEEDGPIKIFWIDLC